AYRDRRHTRERGRHSQPPLPRAPRDARPPNCHWRMHVRAFSLAASAYDNVTLNEAARRPLPASLFPLLVEVATGVDQLLYLQLTEFLADHIPHSVITLEFPLDHHKGRESHHLGILLDEILGDDHVDESELVLHQQEYSTLRALRLLADGDQPRGGDPLSSFQLLELFRVEHSRGA